MKLFRAPTTGLATPSASASGGGNSTEGHISLYRSLPVALQAPEHALRFPQRVAKMLAEAGQVSSRCRGSCMDKKDKNECHTAAHALCFLELRRLRFEVFCLTLPTSDTATHHPRNPLVRQLRQLHPARKSGLCCWFPLEPHTHMRLTFTAEFVIRSPHAHREPHIP